MQESVIYQEIYGEGKEKGKLEEKLDISLSMLKKGISINDIAEITGLSVELIQKLANNN